MGKLMTSRDVKVAPSMTEVPADSMTAVLQVNGQTVGIVLLDPKSFRTGSKGFWGQGKVQIGAHRYQVQVQAVQIGSKPAAK
jgi:hypothetical protein